MARSRSKVARFESPAAVLATSAKSPCDYTRWDLGRVDLVDPGTGRNSGAHLSSRQNCQCRWPPYLLEPLAIPECRRRIRYGQ